MANVKFLSVKLRSTFDALENKESNALYWIEETQELYKGSTLFGTGALATAQAAGLLSAEDKAKLDALAASGGGIVNLTPVDGTIVITDAEGGGKSIGVGLSTVDGNILTVKEDGLYAEATQMPEYAIEKQTTPEDGYAASYKLKKTIGNDVTYVGDVINIAKDMVLQSATLEIVAEANVPYDGAVIGDPYIKMVFNDTGASNLYVPVKELVDKFEAGSGIAIENNVISVKLADVTHGLVAVNGALALELATENSDGAMSKEMFAAVNGLLNANIATKEDVTSIISETVGIPNAEQFDIDENGVLTLKDIDADKVVYNGEKLSDIIGDMSASYTWAELPEIVNADVTTVASAIASANSGAVVKMSTGTVSEAVAVEKSVTVEGENAGVAQNYQQEV